MGCPGCNMTSEGDSFCPGAKLLSDWCLCALTNKAWALLPLVGCQQWGSSGLDGLAANTWITSLMKMLLEARWLTAKADLRGNYVGHSAKWFIEHSVLLKTHLKEFKRGKEKKKKQYLRKGCTSQNLCFSFWELSAARADIAGQREQHVVWGAVWQQHHSMSQQAAHHACPILHHVPRGPYSEPTAALRPNSCLQTIAGSAHRAPPPRYFLGWKWHKRAGICLCSAALLQK